MFDGPEAAGGVISSGGIEVHKWGLHTKFCGSSSSRSSDIGTSSNWHDLQNSWMLPTGSS